MNSGGDSDLEYNAVNYVRLIHLSLKSSQTYYLKDDLLRATILQSNLAVIPNQASQNWQLSMKIPRTL